MTQAPDEPRVSRHLSRVGKRLIAGYFDPAVPRALKGLAVEQDTTMQALLARAINDLLEKHGRGRPASEAPLPRGGAAQLARAEAEESATTKAPPSKSVRTSRNPRR